ncbi:SDR family NAD(P)-dependent oxidoreductase [Acuticoccus sp.]|uniref:SDR family NAD(P)-dependent oxidoreductase n=1 Tax=Acuticoccus sp. TaxID=1904378 RepID=UPI003B52C35A
MGRLDGKIVFITGAGGGIGRSMCERFCAEGANVMACDINEASLAATADAARATSPLGEIETVVASVSEEAEVTRAVAAAVERFGGLTTLANVAGGSTQADADVVNAPVEEFWRAITLDLFGTFLCSKVAIPQIAKSGGGSVINMASMVALMALPGRACYTAAKGGVTALTRHMAESYGRQKIRVNAIAPSVTMSDRVATMMEVNADLKRLADMHLVGLGEPIDVAHLAVYLASDESRIVTGQVIPVDSGVTIY